jgi:hypothetical protein
VEEIGRNPGSGPAADMDNRVTGWPALRFAIGVFDGWDGVKASVQELAASGVAANNIYYLALRRVLFSGVPVEGGGNQTSLQELPFPGNVGVISTTPGPVAKRLAARLDRGAQTLKAALGDWLIPRHAAHLQDAVEGGKIVLWVQLFDNDDERRAYRSLLARSSNSVGVHDLVGD